LWLKCCQSWLIIAIESAVIINADRAINAGASWDVIIKGLFSEGISGKYVAQIIESRDKLSVRHGQTYSIDYS